MRIGLLSIAVLLAAASSAAAQDLKLLFDSLREPAAQEIRILDALYGQDQQVCRAYDAVAQLCDGRDYCEIEADARLCGDPYANVRKQLFIGYDCGDGRRSISVDEGQVARIYCLGERPRDEPRLGAGPPAGWQRDGLYIERAEYGIEGRACDATQAFAFTCNGQSRCRLKVNNKLCGDPARGYAKAAVVQYWCNGQRHEATIKERQTAELRCG